MICTKCDTPGVLNSANNQEFYYCRTCKDEIYAASTEGSPTSHIPHTSSSQDLLDIKSSRSLDLGGKTHLPKGYYIDADWIESDPGDDTL